MATPGPSQPRNGNKKENQGSQSKINLSGLKHQLPGAAYQVKLAVVVSLANARKSMDSDNNFTFTVMAESRGDSEEKSRNGVPDKFDDIVYKFRDGTKAGSLKIQAKHKLSKQDDKDEESAANEGNSGVELTRKDQISPKLKLNDFIPQKQETEQKISNGKTQKKHKDTFAIGEYYDSFKEQQQGDKQQQTTGIEGYILCTNAALDDDAKALWNEIAADVPNDSTTPLDSYISSLFHKTGGKCYQLKTHYKRSALARLLINAIKSIEHIITCQRPLFKEYRAAILDIIDRDSISGNIPLYRFTGEFLDSSCSKSKPGYKAFRNEFEDQYRQEFKIDGCVWKDLEQKRVYVSRNFLSGGQNTYPSSNMFPEESLNDVFKSFCNQFRLVCGTYNEKKLDLGIVEIWRDLHFHDTQPISNQLPKSDEEQAVTDRLFIIYYDWLKDPYAKPLDSKDILKQVKNIDGILVYKKLEPISNTLHTNVVGSPFRVSTKALKDSKLYNQVQTENLLAVEAFDIQFGATLLLDTLDCYFKNHMTSLFLNDSDFLLNSVTAKAVLRCVEPLPCLIIICNEAFEKCQGIVTKWKEDILKDPAKHIFLLQKSSNTESVLNEFRICDLTEESWNWFLGESIHLCTTTILPSKIFENNFLERPIEEVIRLLNWGKKMEENNEISKKHREIESTYVHRPWVDSESKLEAVNIQWHKESCILKRIKEPQEEGMSFNEIIEMLKKDPNVIEMFEKANNAQEEHEPIVGGGAEKVLILLGEAGLGKSTNLTYMAWYFRKQKPSSWVVRCNLSDHCTSFEPYIQHQNNRAGKVIDETEALRMLYKLVCSSIQIHQEMTEKCSKYLDLSDGIVNVIEDLIADPDFSLNDSILLLVFKEKFNAGKLLLLLDGFDEIAPLYKEVVLKFLFHFELFKGVEKLYLTSRPYGFKEQFQMVFKNPSFFKLKTLFLHDKASILNKLMKEKWHGGNIDDAKALADFYKSLCFMLLGSLGDMSNIPLNLMMAVDIVGERVYQNGNINTRFPSKSFSKKLLELIVDLSKGSFIVEEFVKVKIRHLLYDKIGADKKAPHQPEQKERFEKAIDETKLLHGLVALWVFFNNHERHIILSPNEIKAGEDYMKKIHEGGEKTGIIHANPNGGITFIHWRFTEYLAAWWIINRRIEGNKQVGVKMSSFQPFWDEERKDLRKNIDTILAKRLPLNVAIIEREWKTVESLLSTIPESLYETDDGNRTPFHLIAIYYDFAEGWPHFLPDSINTRIMRTKDKLFGWTALDYAFHMDKPQLIYYLLHHGASINVEVLYDQIVSSEKHSVRNAAKYARYVMGYLSSEVIEYESHDACKTMKQFCDKVVASLDNETSENFEPMQDGNNKIGDDSDCNRRKIVQCIIAEDSVWMLESIIHRWAGRKHFVRMISNSFLNLDTDLKFVLRHFMVKYSMHPSIINDDNLWDCIILSVKNNYNNEFECFYDFYCSRIKIKGFQFRFIQIDSIDGTIQTEEACYLINYVENNIKDLISDFRHNIYLSQLKIPTEILIDEQTLSLLIICVGTVRSSMLKYLVESCKLNLCAGIVYSLAMITYNLFTKIPRKKAIIPNPAYKCLLDHASNISDFEANKMLRLAITSELFEFSKCLIQRYKIDFRAVDIFNGWNVFHLCASNHRLIWVKNLAADDTRAAYVDGDRADLFRFMVAKVTDMDCFGLIDKRGRSILHLAMEKGQRSIVEHIVARKLGLNHIHEIRYLGIETISNITFCYRAIREISRSIGEQWSHYGLICMLAERIAKISLTNRKESQESNSGRLVLQQDATELYQMAMKCRSLFLMYYLHLEFPNAMPPLIYDADWLRCTADFLDFTKWLLNPNEVDKHANLYEVVEECDAEGYDYTSVNLEKLLKQVEAILSANRSVEELCKLKLLAVAVCLKRESMIRHLCESLNVNIDWKVLIDIMVIAHGSYIYKAETKDTDGCAFEKPDFTQIYTYLLKRTSNLGEIDAEGSNVLHLAAQNGLDCMAKFLIKHNMLNVTITNEQNGWNIFHYYASRKGYWRCCYTENDKLLELITKRVLEITSDGFPISSLTEDRKNKIKELCFYSKEGRKNVIHFAVEAGNISTAEYIIKCRLVIGRIGDHEISDSDECSRFRECYDELNQIAAQLPFNGWCDFLLHRLAKPIHRYSPENIEHIKGQENGEDHIVEEACRSAIKYRSLITLEHLIIECEDQMNQALVRGNSPELVSCMMECIRRNRTSMFKVFVGHYRTLQGIQPTVEVELEVEENDNIDEVSINEYKINWQIINELPEDVCMNRHFLSLFIWLVAYGRLSMTGYLVEMLQLEVNKPLIVLIMKVLEDLWNQNCKVATPVYEYLANRCEGKPHLLHLCIQAGCYKMLKYLIEERKLDPNEIDLENGWNAGHYFVSGPIWSGSYEFVWLVDQYDVDCFGVYDRKGRSTLHYALENGYDGVVEYIINHRIGLIGDKQPWYEWNSEKIEELINELQQTIKSLPEKIPHQEPQIIQDVLDTVVCYMRNRASLNLEQFFNPDCKNDNDCSENKNREETIGDNSVSIFKKDQTEANEKLFFELIRTSYLKLALESKSVSLLAYFMASDPSRLPDEYLWKCAAYAAYKNYNIEFKSFFDLYCSHIKIKNFQPCSIQTDKAYYFNDHSKSDEIDEVCDLINNISWSKFRIIAETMIHKKILSLLAICVATVRPYMLRYLVESCKLNLCAGTVYSLALIANNLLSKKHRKPAVKPNPAYKCLLDFGSNISDIEANKMLRLAITSELFEFSKFLIERYNIDFQAVDETNGWNVFHLCASNQRSFWLEKIVADNVRALITPAYVDGDRTDLFRFMVAKVTDVDCFDITNKKRRSILHLAMENERRGLVEHIVARKLRLHHIKDIRNLGIEAISNITICYRAIRKISKSVGVKWWHYKLICRLAKQIAKISLTNREELQESNSGRLLLQEDDTELYQMAMKCRSLLLMLYLHREFPNAIPPMIYDADWLKCTVDSLRSPDFLDFTKWLLNPNDVEKYDNLYKVVEECGTKGFDYTSVDLEKLVKQVEASLSANRSVEEVCKLKLLGVAVCLKRESMIRHLCETLNVNIDWKVLIDIMEIAHGSYIYKAETKDTDGCAFEKPDFTQIYTYLLKRTSNLGEIDAEGSNVLHLAAQNGLDCMAKFLIKHNMLNVTITNEQNGWNIFHYYASRKGYWRCCYTENDDLLELITKRVLEITSDGFPFSSLTESRKNKLKELCFNSDEGRKSVIYVAVEAGNINTAEYIIQTRLGFGLIDKHEIRNSYECSRFRECYDELNQIAAQLPFNGWCDYLLHILAKSIHRFSPENIEHITGQEDVEDHVVKDAWRSAIKYRSLIKLEHLFNASEDQTNQALARSTGYELVSCMMECIRRNRTSMFKVLVGHYRTFQGIRPRVEVEFEVEENNIIDEVKINEKRINWPIINEFTENVAMNRDYLPLLILSVAYGRLPMTRYLVEMLQLEVNKSLIVLIMKVLQDLWDQNCGVATPVYEYLANRCEGNPSLLHLCTQAGCYKMLKYLVEERKLDPNEIDSENEWNAGHYSVSGISSSGYKEFTWLVDQNMDCLGVYDRKGRNILHLALENDRNREVQYIINHRLGLTGDKQPWYEWDSEKIEKLINELQRTLESLPENVSHQEQQFIRNILEKMRFQRDFLTTYQQLFTHQT